jgi:hypothetical protein
MELTRQAEVLMRIIDSHKPHSEHEAFNAGFVAWQGNRFTNPFRDAKEPRGQVAAEAWNHGAKAALRFATWQGTGCCR